MRKSLFEHSSERIKLAESEGAVLRSKLGLIGFPSGGRIVRSYLKQYHLSPYADQFIDMGDIPVEQHKSTSDIVLALKDESECIPIVVSSPEMSRTYEARHMQAFHRPTFVRSNPKLNDTFHHVGIQGHMIDESWTWDQDKHLRLGQIKDSIEDAEVMLRNADYIDIDLNVLRADHLQAPISPSSAGLDIEELCHIAKYIGASTQLRAVTISGYNTALDPNEIMARHVALIIWYINEGYDIRRREINQDHLEKSYTVIPDGVDGELVFIEHQKTGRWWIQLYADCTEELVRMACTQEDYDAACRNELSDRVTSLLSRV